MGNGQQVSGCHDVAGRLNRERHIPGVVVQHHGDTDKTAIGIAGLPNYADTPKPLEGISQAPCRGNEERDKLSVTTGVADRG